MTKNLLIKTLMYWFLFIPVAIINGTIRVYGYQPWVGELVAHQISTFTAIILFLGIIFWFVRQNYSQATQQNMFGVGFIWLVLTIIFEFGFGHYLMGHSWSKLLYDYNLLAGRLWILVLVTILLGPLWMLKSIKPKKVTHDE